MGASAQNPSWSFPLGRGQDDYGKKYTSNLYLVLSKVGDGSWVIPAHQKVCFIAQVGNLNIGWQLPNYQNIDVYGAGACDVATWFYYVASQNGLVPSVTNPKVQLDVHPKIPGVPMPHGISIYQPGLDMCIENTSDQDAVFRWVTDDKAQTVKIWVEHGNEISTPTPSAQPVIQPLPAMPLALSEVVSRIRWDYVGFGALGLLFLLVLFRKQVVLGAYRTYRHRDEIKRLSEVGLKESLEYWAVILVAFFMIIPDAQEGFRSWFYGYTTIKNSNLMLFIAALLVTLVYRNVRRARFEREWNMGKPESNPLKLKVVLICIVIAGVVVGAAGYTVPTAAASIGECAVSQKFPQSVLKWCSQITREARANGLDPDLDAALILQESGGQPEIMSNQGAVGLMQVMPRDGYAASFQCKAGPCFANRPSIAELKDPGFNLSYGTRMLAALIHANGQRDGLKAYGPSGMGYTYADIVLGLYEKYRK
jgi:hypothetical protein